MPTDAASEGRHDSAVLDVELGVSDLGLRVVDRGLRCVAFVGSLVDTLGGRELIELELLRASKLTGGEQ